ncbi:hypothetical protein [Streptomyces sp. NPDC004788]
MDIKKRIGIAIALAFAATTLAFGTAAALDQGPTYVLAGNVISCP